MCSSIAVPVDIDHPRIINIESRSVTVEISAPAKPNGVIIHYACKNTEFKRCLVATKLDYATFTEIMQF